MLEKMFKLKENNTTAKTEVIAGITTDCTAPDRTHIHPSHGAVLKFLLS